MSNIRVYDLAHKFDIPSREFIEMLKKHGIDVKSHMSSLDERAVALIHKIVAEKKGKNGVVPKKEDTTSREKKIGARTYIPPRRRQKNKHGSVERVVPPRPPLEREHKKTIAGPQKRVPPSPGTRKPHPPSREVDQKPPTVATHRVDTSKKKEVRSESGGKPQRYQKKEVRSESGGKPQRYQKKEGTTKRTTQPEVTRFSRKEQEHRPRRGVTKTRTETTGSGPVKQKGAPSQRPSKPHERGQRKTGAGGAAQHDKSNNRQNEQKSPEAQQQQKKSTTFQRPKGGLRPPHRSKRPYRKPGTKPSASKAPAKTPAPQVKVEEVPTHLEIPEVIMVKELAEKMHAPPAKVIRHLMTMGVMVNVNQVLDTEAAISIAEHFGFEAKAVSTDEDARFQVEAVDESKLKPRPPVVTIMGHVDHGKTTLLDAIRESKITDTEFGGITQHIGAYSVDLKKQRIVFLDTPGHEAFTAMRARGAKVTDEVILVVAADDGIMPQTIEAIDHARAANVPIIVAINKTDLPGANPDRVMQELTKHGLTPEEWGGDTICVKVSAKQRTNLDALLEMILLQAEMLELKADPERRAQGVVVEALLDKGRGPVATVLVHHGTLRIGDPFVVGLHYGRVRAMLDDRGKRVPEVGPATPVEVLGFTGVPVAGDAFVVVENERRARHIAESRQEQQQMTEFARTAKITLEELHRHIEEGKTQELRIVIKADVHGSVEALSDSLERLSTEKVRLQVIHGGVGAINESDVMLATASNAIVLGFNVRPVAKAHDMAEKEQIDVRLYTIIYQAIDDVKKAMEGLLEPTYKEVFMGRAVVQALFKLPKAGIVAGCRVSDGKIMRNAIVKLIRENQELFKGNISSLRRVKDDVREVMTGYECGIRLENYNDVRVADVIEAYTLEKVTMRLDGTEAK